MVDNNKKGAKRAFWRGFLGPKRGKDSLQAIIGSSLLPSKLEEKLLREALINHKLSGEIRTEVAEDTGVVTDGPAWQN